MIKKFKNSLFFTTIIRLAATGMVLTIPTRPLQAQDTNVDFQATQAAAEKGDAKAQYELARRYEKGNGVPQDYAKAADYLHKSADQGYAAAQGQLGYFYGSGMGVAQDPAEALNWYRKAADQGNAVSQFAMGYIYSTGRGVPADTDKAVEWWQKAAGQDLPEAENALGQYYLDRARTNRTLYVESFNWLHKAADHGYVDSMNNLGVLYQFGRGVKLNWDEAAKWFGIAAEQGRSSAQFDLGVLYESGEGVPIDLVQAYKWLELGYEQGNKKCQAMLVEIANSKNFSPSMQAEADQMVKEYHASHPPKTQSQP